jgi:hypothetical protein
MSEGSIFIKKIAPIIAVTWILSLITTLGLVYVAPNMFPQIYTVNLGDGAITSGKMADGAIITTKLADGTVTSAKILDGTITATDLADGAILAIKIADGAVIATKIADGAISTAKIVDGAIVTLKLADESVTSSKVADGAIDTDKLSNGSVTTSKISDDAVTTSKIVDDAIITIKLTDDSVTTAKIQDGTITAADLDTGLLSSIGIADGSVTTVKIADYAVTNIKLASGAIPFNSTYSEIETTTTSGPLTFVDMADMSVTLTLTRTSHVLIMFSTEAMNDNPNYRIFVQAFVGTDLAIPGAIYLTPTVAMASTPLHNHALDFASYAYNFYKSSVNAGTYTIKIQWAVSGGGTGHAFKRTLTAIALPA